MTRLVKFIGGFAVVAAMAVSAPMVAKADDKDVIDYRQHIMKTLGEQAQSLAMVLQGKAPAENVAIHAQLLAVTAATVEKAFVAKVPGGEAKADVWAKWDDFSKKAKETAAAAADLAKVAQSGGVEAAKAKMAAPGLGCKGCHDTYREQKK